MPWSCRGMAAVPVITAGTHLCLFQGAPFCGVCPTIAQFVFFSSVDFLCLLAFPCSSLPSSNFTGRTLGFSLRQLSFLSRWVALLVGLFPLPDVSFFLPTVSRGLAHVESSLAKGNICSWRPSLSLLGNTGRKVCG